MKAYKSAPLKAIHSTIEDLHALGAVDDATMRDFDERCLVHGADIPASERKPSILAHSSPGCHEDPEEPRHGLP